MVSLPESTDRRDGIVLASDASGFRTEWVDGVRPNRIPKKALPPDLNLNRDELSYGSIGNWRAHMNALQR